MKIDFLNRLNPEMECIALLERRFRTGADASHNIEELRTHLSTTYNIPTFELEPLLAPLIDVENYVNKNLAVREERLRFFFIPRSNGLSSLGGALFSMLQSRLHYGSLSKERRLQELIQVLSRITGMESESWQAVTDLDSLIRFLLSCNCTEDVKWISTALYYSIEEYLEELDVILRKATGLFLDHLPDLTALCQEAIRCAQEQIGDDPSMIFHGVSMEQLPPHVTVIPSAMNFHGLQWDMGSEQLYYGIFYPNLTNLIAKYSDQGSRPGGSSEIHQRQKPPGDSPRGQGQLLQRAGSGGAAGSLPRHHFAPHEPSVQRESVDRDQAGHQHLLRAEPAQYAPVHAGIGALSVLNQPHIRKNCGRANALPAEVLIGISRCCPNRSP